MTSLLAVNLSISCDLFICIVRTPLLKERTGHELVCNNLKIQRKATHTRKRGTDSRAGWVLLVSLIPTAGICETSHTASHRAALKLGSVFWLAQCEIYTSKS